MSWRMMLIALKIIIIGLSLAPYSNLTFAAAPEKKLFIAIGMEPTTIDPSACWAGSGDYQVVENYAEYLIYKAPSGDLKPGLATSWKMSPNGKEIEFTLRRGVKFHSGDFLTSKDVEFSFERGRAKSSTVKSRLRSVERFEVIDDYRFKVQFKTPDVTFIPNRGGPMMVSKSYYDRVGEDRFSKYPVGTAPYKFVRYVSGEYVDIERFEGYWGEKPPVREARTYFVPEDTTRVAKLKAGEVDLISTCPYTSVKDIEKSPGFKTIRLPLGHPSVSLAFSTQNPNNPWYDRRVRLAMAYAVDCDSIIKHVLYDIPDHYPFLAPYELGYDPHLKHYPCDPKRAKELLVEAGYPKGFDCKIYWLAGGRVPMSREVSEAVAAYLEAVGVKCKLIGEEIAQNLSRRKGLNRPDTDYVCISSFGRAGMPDPTYVLDLFFTKDGGFSHYINPEIEKITVEARATMDDTKRGS